MTDRHEVPEGQIADAVTGNWVDRRAPARLKPYLRLSRLDRPIGTWLLLLPCWWGLALAGVSSGWFGLYDLWIGLSCGIGAILMRGAGCTWNDITDRDIDGSVARTALRPIPAGDVTVRQALAWAVLQSLVAFGILLTYSTTAIWLGILALLPVAIYPFAKRFTWWPQIFLGLAFNWGALLAWSAHTGALGLPAVLLYAGGMAWTLFYDTIYAHQDKEDDALIGVKSTARLFGDATPRYLAIFLGLTMALLGTAVLLAVPEGATLQLVLCLGGVLAMGAHLYAQLRQLDLDDNDGLLRLFRSNRNAGLMPVLFFAAALLA
ncbi:4-hydroxybenzoate octaprenyltransferase [Roseivivax sp. THAF40]|uniref:4-hydroxybenzoate octaprenyltransferase n=1 Tax=unclassified Roseivivax TaxID=2639302 RepID=UPI001268398A|nr:MULTISPECIES: 4-hydroxybenzoate octaprenyltransferase [unclassified Roseivivax]QFS84455.1 4-hydroxybenzoate octaprenyltransferase [Roseivivax sp. THAF197b]QFT48283.1 4-hydroxybenzoate octaprenyltransferase [Roseivivax sp. THAF40]